MEVILKRDVPNVGRIGEVVNVRNGYARNFLFPRSLAIPANHGNKAMLEHARRLVEREKTKVRQDSEEKAKEVGKVKLSLKKKFNAQDKMFGSVTAAEVVVMLQEQGWQFDRRDIEMPDVRSEGSYEIKLRLPGDVYTSVKLKIDAEKEVEKKTRGKKVAGSKPKAKAKTAKSAKSEDEASESLSDEQSTADTSASES